MNIDGVSAAIQCELNIPAEAAKGIFPYPEEWASWRMHMRS